MDEDDQVDQLIEKSLRMARSLIESGGIWGSLVHIVHPGGVESLISKGLHSDPGERTRVNEKINLLMEVLKSNLLIAISDAWIGEGTDGSVAISYGSPFPGRRKALVVEIWGCNQRLTGGMQEYKRLSDGQVFFGEFLWADSDSSSGG